MVMQNANISEMASKMALQTVASYLSKQLPAPIAGQVEALIAGGGGGGAAGMLGDAMKGFGKKDDGDDKGGLGGALGSLLG